jgi:hypothetical protein
MDGRPTVKDGTIKFDRFFNLILLLARAEIREMWGRLDELDSTGTVTLTQILRGDDTCQYHYKTVSVKFLW